MNPEIRLLSTSQLEYLLGLNVPTINSVFELSGGDPALCTFAHAAIYLIDLAWGATDPSKRVWYLVNVELRSPTSATVKVTRTSRELKDRYWERHDKFTVGELELDGSEESLNSDAVSGALGELIVPDMRERTL
jgi:hypothetical protein